MEKGIFVLHRVRLIFKLQHTTQLVIKFAEKKTNYRICKDNKNKNINKLFVKRKITKYYTLIKNEVLTLFFNYKFKLVIFLQVFGN